jgi:hypothetical protein
MTNPIIWVAIVGWVLAGGVYAVKTVQEGRQWQTAYGQGLAAGKASAGSAVIASATEAVREERKALDDTPLTAERAAIIAACKREASCRERGKL